MILEDFDQQNWEKFVKITRFLLLIFSVKLTQHPLLDFGPENFMKYF
jgi:hypothetical protein